MDATLGDATLSGAAFYCPVCLKRVRRGAARPRAYQQACVSGLLDVLLLLCPRCGTVLAAEPAVTSL